jgi:plasmid replication initiation protein
MKAKETDLVVKTNKLVEASYRLDLNEQRLVLAAIVEGRESDLLYNNQPIKISAKRFAAIFGLDESNAYRLMKEAKNRLYERSVTIEDEEDGSVGAVRWVEGVFHKDGSGFVKLKFSSYVAPHLARLETEYTEYRLERIGKLTSYYAVRIYELCAQCRNKITKEREESLPDLRRKLGIDESEYSGRTAIADFKRRVLDPAIKQINTHTDLHVSYENIKTGRTVTGLLFSISEKTATPEPTKKKAAKPPKITREYIEKNNLARAGESWDEAFRRLAEERGQQRLVD